MNLTSPSSPTVRAALYARVSTDAQEHDGTSLATQIDACVAHCEERGWEVVEQVRESASGAMLDRRGLDRVRRMVTGGEVDVVVAYAVDRLARSQNHIGILFDELERHAVNIETVTEPFEASATGRFIVQARAFMAEVERDKIAERTMRGKRETARQGRIPQGTGAGIYGYHLIEGTGRRELNGDQAEVVASVFAAFAGGASTLSIANSLNDRGIPTFTGKRWQSATIHHMLRTETYTGRTTYLKTKTRFVAVPAQAKKKRLVEARAQSDWIEVDGATPAIIDGDTFAFVQSLLNDPERRRRGRPKYEYRLSSRIRCGLCGAAMTGQTLNGGRYRYYRCRRTYAGPKGDRCVGTYIRANDLEAEVLGAVTDALARPEVIQAEAQRRREELSATIDVPSLQRELRELDAQQARLAETYELGIRTKHQFDQRVASLRRRRIGVERQLRPLQDLPPLPDHEALLTACDRLRRRLVASSGPELKLALAALNVSVVAGGNSVEVMGTIPPVAAEPPGKAAGYAFTVSPTNE